MITVRSAGSDDAAAWLRMRHALIAAAERWGRDQGCSEFASDASAENEISKVAHLALGFDDVGLQRCFRKDL